MTSRGAEKMKDDTIGVDVSKDHLAKNRGKVLAAPLLKRHNAQRLEQIKRQITAIEAAILEQVQADPISPNGSQSSPPFRACRPSPPSPC